MKQLTVTLVLFVALCGLSRAGVEYSGKETAQTSPCPEWYGDTEWNVSVWGTYAFTGAEWAPNLDLVDLIVSTTEGKTVLGSFDKYLGNDHAWGGGIDVKYFFHRYFGVGIQGFLLDAHKTGFDIDLTSTPPATQVFLHQKTTEHRAVGSVLGTFTLRYPVRCTRFSPYAWAGVGAIFGGGESDTLITHEIPGIPPDSTEPPFVNAHTRHFDGETKLMGQFGGGLEVRVSRHIGWMTDYSWNAIDGPKNNFGMFRTGINVAF